MMQRKIILPWPPSTNKVWRPSKGGKLFLRGDTRRYRQEVILSVVTQRIEPMPPDLRLSVVIEAHPPDSRRRDLDNIVKSILDAIVRAGTFDDDARIDHLVVIRRGVVPGGEVTVTITHMEDLTV